MKLRNKRTGEKAEVEINYNSMLVTHEDGRIVQYYFDSLKDLEEWEDYHEEPKEYWHIFGTNITKTQEGLDEVYDKRNKEIGNYFENKEEAEKAVECLRAWKRLKEKGFRFCSWFYDIENQEIKIKAEFKEFEEVIVGQKRQDLDLLFSGEDD